MNTLDELKLELLKIPWFRDLKIKHLEMLSGITHLCHAKAGEVLFREGDKEDYVYIVLNGRVALDMLVLPRGKVRLYTAEAQEVFGWSSVTPVVHQRTAGATAVTDVFLAAVDANKLRELCEADHDLGYVVMRRLANVVASRLLVTRLQLLDMFSHPEDSHAK
ncbi:MAG: Crp/Fnr family transcriptional regulator [Anaerolineales bacterium]